MSNKDNKGKTSRMLMWKLLRKHISPSQLLGFSLASLVGLTIVILAVQFYLDVRQTFNDEDSFLKKDYLIITREVMFVGGNNVFEPEAIKDIEAQPWCRKVGKFTSNDYSIYASFNMGGQSNGLSTMLFFESIPNEFIDVTKDEWKFDPNKPVVPVIVSRDYLTLYNFGFATSQGLPQVSENVISNVRLHFTLRGNSNIEEFDGRIIGFSSRLNTILVPEEFMEWSNEKFGSGENRDPSRLIIEVNSPGDESIGKYLTEHGYQVAGDKMQQSKAQGFLYLVIWIVIGVGILISVLAFFILILSIYLLLQKNTKKLQDLLVLGYSPGQISKTYIYMVVFINIAVMILSIILMLLIRAKYLPYLKAMDINGASIVLSVIVAFIIMSLITLGNVLAIKRKIKALWIQKS